MATGTIHRYNAPSNVRDGVVMGDGGEAILSASSLASVVTLLQPTLDAIFAPISVTPTYVQSGTNISTGGTISRPTVNLNANVTLTSLTFSDKIYDQNQSNGSTAIYYKSAIDGSISSHSEFVFDENLGRLNIWVGAGVYADVGGFTGFGSSYLTTALIEQLEVSSSAFINGSNLNLSDASMNLTNSSISFVTRTPVQGSGPTSIAAEFGNGIFIMDFLSTLSGRSDMTLFKIDKKAQMAGGITTPHIAASGVSYGNIVSGVTYYSGGTLLSHLLGQGGSSTYVQPGLNITTGGTASVPIINTTSSPTFTAITSNSISGTSISATTFYSGGTDLNHLLGQGGATYTGTTIVDFGHASFGEGDFTAVTVSNVNVGNNSNILFKVFASDDHPMIEESLLDEVTFRESDIVQGSSFVLNAYSERGTWGQYNVVYKIIN